MPNSNHQVVVVSARTPDRSHDNARKIAEFMGAPVLTVSLEAAQDSEGARRLVPPCAALVLSVGTVVHLAEPLGPELSWLASLLDAAPQVFLYGFDSTERHAAILRALTSDGLTGLEALPEGAPFTVADAHRESCGQFSGLSFQGVDASRDAGFTEGSPLPSQAVLIRAAGRPFFVRVDRGATKVFLSAGNDFADLDEKTPREPKLLPWFSRLAPLMMFLRSALGDRLWHSAAPQACLIVDDPWLRPRYGFLEYAKLLEAMRGERFSASIAFIPWNYRKWRQQAVDSFHASPSALSLCVHGCDHTWGEFADESCESLCGKARSALERMDLHRQRSGVPFDDVMVFPQGLFSRAAVRALGATGYLAATNTDLSPWNLPRTVTLRDALDVAVTAFADFPLFARQYPRELAEFAFYMFLGKPVLLVEHHGYFRHGYGALREFVERLNRLDERLQWANLANICSRACRVRVASEDEVHVQFYTNRFQFAHAGSAKQNFLFFRRRTSESPLPAVTVNGHPGASEQIEGHLVIRLALDPGQQADIRIPSDGPLAARGLAWKPTPAHQAKVFARQFVRELSDNHLETNRLMGSVLAGARRLRARVKAAIKVTLESQAWKATADLPKEPAR